MAENKVDSKNYVALQGWMLKELKLKGNELIIYAIIYGFSQLEGQRFTGSMQYLADWTNSSKESVRKCLNSLVSKGYIAKFERRINGVKYCEYSALKSCTVYNKVGEGIQQSCIGVYNKVGEGIQQSCTNNIEDNITDNIEDNNTSNSDEFEHLWSIYPRKQGKKAAYEAYLRAVKKGCTNEEIEAGILRYNEHIQRNKTATKYIKQGSTYFRNESWNDVFEDGDTRGVVDEYGRLNFSKQYWDDSDPTVF